MKRFSQLIEELDRTTSTLKKVDALRRYFDDAGESDRLWTIALLGNRRPKRTVRTSLLAEWAAEVAGIPGWLFEITYHTIGDLSETIALVWPKTEMAEADAKASERPLTYYIDLILALKDVPDEEKRTRVVGAWTQLDETGRFVFNKIITGEFRIGVSQKLMVRALAQHTGAEENHLAHLLMGAWDPRSTSFAELMDVDNASTALSRPFPFYLAYALDMPPEELGGVEEWLVERKWDGIRGQLIVRKGEVHIWSRGEELITDKFPELHPLRTALPSGTVLDGEILPFTDGLPLPFQQLQTRIGRVNVTAKVLREAPVVLMAYDLLEYDGADLRERPLQERRAMLEELVARTASPVLRLSPRVHGATWAELAAERERSREERSEGLMLKRLDSPYRVGRKRGDWWKWKVDPLTVDGVLIYAQYGHGRRADLFTDLTFAAWSGTELVPFAKAYSGLTDAEIMELDSFVKQHTLERFGPVRSVTPSQVFELHFEGIQRSPRHKSGIALRFPRIARWRKDKVAKEANTLEDLRQLLDVYAQG
jgi:DNA ligase-1